VSIDGARGVVLNVVGGEDLGLLEVYDAAEIVARAVDPDAQIMFGAVVDPHMPPGQVRVTLIATGLDPSRSAPQRTRNFIVGAPRPAAQAPAVLVPAVQAPVAVPVEATRSAAPAAEAPTATTPVGPLPRRSVAADDLDVPAILRRYSAASAAEA
jgi:cell division protein FtsZ